jgi:hypothetical protein
MDNSESRPSRRKLVGQGLLALAVGTLVAAAVLYVPVAGWTTNDVTTGKHPGYPDLQSRVYDMEPSHCAMFAAQAARRLGWEVVETRPEAGTVRAVVTVFPIPFKDDLTVTATPDPKNPRHTVVEIRSRSRVGRGDLGENARHVRALQAAMDDKLPRAR